MDQNLTTIQRPKASDGSKAATILIVEDSPVQAELLRRALEGAGYKVIAARDGAEGLAMSKADHPAAVVSDINMPVMDGYAMCHAIRGDADLKHTPVILLTMLSDPEDVIHGLNAGADAYLTKPYNIPSLVSRVASLLAYPPAPPPETERRKVEVRLAGETHLIDAHGPRMLNLLISTYENAVLQNRELTATQQALDDLNQHLEQKVLEKTAELRESEQRFRALIENVSDLVLVIDAQGMITYASPSATRVGGYEPGELLGKSITAFIHPDDIPTALADLSALTHNPGQLITREFRYRGKEGDWIILETIAKSAMDDPTIAGVVINARDITERKQGEERLRRSSAELKEAQRVAQVGNWNLNPGTGNVTWSEEVYRIFGRDPLLPAPSYAEHPRILVPESYARLNAAIEKARQTGELFELDLQLVRPDDTRKWITARGEVKRDFNDQIVGLRGTALDITERKQAEEQLRRLNWALRALGQSNSALVHAGTEIELFQSCCEAIAGAEGYPLVWVGLARDDAAHSIEIVAGAGDASKFLEGFAASWKDEPAGRGPAGTAIRTGVTQVTNDLAESAAFAPWIESARANGLASSINLPIRTDGAALGILVVYSREEDAFGQSEVELFEELAADIGYGIASRRTHLAYEASLVEREGATHKLRAAFESLIAVLAATVERRDPYTAGHQRRVAELCLAIGRTLGLDPARIEGLHFAATIHDIGKIYVPAEILARPGKLSSTEFELVKSHAQVGFEIVKDVEFPWQVADMIRQHHERLDGSGYPQGLKGDQILLESRILAVADVVEAMSSHRPYRAGLGLDAALAQIRQEAGTKLDAQVVDACERVFHEQGFAFSKA
jgi:PAS domain S-box-containing protein/putative nucleotidyltransferase with HDIG domain